jgi:hypothetical protein
LTSRASITVRNASKPGAIPVTAFLVEAVSLRVEYRTRRLFSVSHQSLDHWQKRSGDARFKGAFLGIKPAIDDELPRRSKSKKPKMSAIHDAAIRVIEFSEKCSKAIIPNDYIR